MGNIDLYNKITSQITELMQQHGSDWTRPWTSTAGGPSNALTGDHYKGINTLLLNLEAHGKGYSRPYWATFKQWRMKGGSVRKGQRGTLCVFYKPIVIEQPNESIKTVPVMKHFFLFNADQVDGIEIPETEESVAIQDRNHAVDDLLNGTGAIIHETGSRAYYSPSKDHICIPPLSAFSSSEMFYSTLLHELSHWSGHPTRLNREEGMQSRFGSSAYAMEELVAELASAFLSIQLKVSHEPRKDHAQYLNSWLQVLDQDPKAFSTAASKAQRIADYLLRFNEIKQAA
ncbi:zincin-like metallopeptidase domain-containing protein [Rhodospirillales bacterium]|nr:zincin-like metallopeptidase domain-containing protein [Rhodospirillales bacterium]